nr:MAG: nonstructural protein [Microvirus sp.]
MNQNIYTVYDQKARAYLTPFFMPEDGMAIRTFSDCVNSKDHHFGKHPSDYTLYKMGVYDDNSADLLAIPLQSLGNGVEFVEIPPPEPLNGQKTPISNDAPILAGAESGNTAL